MRFIRAVSASVCAALILTALVPQAAGIGSEVFSGSESTENAQAEDGSGSSFLAAVDSLQTYYSGSMTADRNVPTARVMVGPTALDRRLQSVTAWHSGAAAAAQVGAQTSRLILLHQLSQEDYDTLLRIVEAEATGGDIQSKMLIAGVVMNRVKDDRFPDTITEVVWDRSSDGAAQFSPTSDGRINTVTVTDETVEAVRRVLAGEDYTEGALFFVARSSASVSSLSWFDNNLEVLFAYGGHDFFRFYDEDDEGTVS